MSPRVGRALLLVSLALHVTACGGGDSGPRVRGSAAGGGSGNGLDVDPAARPSLRTVVYLPSYNGTLSSWERTLRYSHISYVNLSFASVDANGNVSYPDAGLSSFVETAHAAGVKVCAALGGATTIADGGVFTALLEDANRPAFIDELVAFAADNQLDCLDVDLEGRGVNQHYEAFVTELAAKLKPQGRELTAAVAGWFADGISDKALATFDFINVMAYDLYHSIEVPMQTSSIEAATREVDRWVERGVPREKVVYGVPFYGFQWPLGGGQPRIVGYGDLLRQDASAATRDLLQGTESIIYLNSRTTIQAKAELAKAYGGIMVWEVSQDAAGDDSLLKAINDSTR
jgi:chitinase